MLIDLSQSTAEILHWGKALGKVTSIASYTKAAMEPVAHAELDDPMYQSIWRENSRGNTGLPALLGHSSGKRFSQKFEIVSVEQTSTSATITGRVARVEEIDAAIGAWSAQRTVQQVLDALGAARVPAGKVYTAKDIAEDPHYRARDMLLTQQTRDGYSVEVPGIVPKLSGTPGTIRSSAPHLGDDTDAVLADAGLTAEQIALLRSKGVIQ